MSWFDRMCVRSSYRHWWRLEDEAMTLARKGRWDVADAMLRRAELCLADARELGSLAFAAESGR